MQINTTLGIICGLWGVYATLQGSPLTDIIMFCAVGFVNLVVTYRGEYEMQLVLDTEEIKRAIESYLTEEKRMEITVN